MELSAFAERVQERLDVKGWTRADLARHSGRKYHEINEWFRRPTSEPSAPALIAVAQALEVEPAHLVLGFDTAEAPEYLRTQVTERLAALTEEELRVLLAAADAMIAQQRAKKEQDQEETSAR